MCFSTEASLSLSASTPFTSVRCYVWALKTKGLHKIQRHKTPRVFWQNTVWFCSPSRVLFTALFTSYRSHSGWWDSCWSISSYTVDLQVLLVENLDKCNLDIGCLLPFLLFYFAHIPIAWRIIALEMWVCKNYIMGTDCHIVLGLLTVNMFK